MSQVKGTDLAELRQHMLHQLCNCQKLHGWEFDHDMSGLLLFEVAVTHIMVPVSPMKWLTRVFRESLGMTETHIKSASVLEPLGEFSIQAYARVFTQRAGEPWNSKIYSLMETSFDAVIVDV